MKYENIAVVTIVPPESKNHLPLSIWYTEPEIKLRAINWIVAEKKSQKAGIANQNLLKLVYLLIAFAWIYLYLNAYGFFFFIMKNINKHKNCPKNTVIPLIKHFIPAHMDEKNIYDKNLHKLIAYFDIYMLYYL